MAFSLTSEQQAAVDNRGGGLLVSAAAGSGKTRVLVERLLARVEGEGLDIDRFLVITYTKAAAAELRGRIVEELSARLAERPTDALIQEGGFPTHSKGRESGNKQDGCAGGSGQRSKRNPFRSGACRLRLLFQAHDLLPELLRRFDPAVCLYIFLIKHIHSSVPRSALIACRPRVRRILTAETEMRRQRAVSSTENPSR